MEKSKNRKLSEVLKEASVFLESQDKSPRLAQYLWMELFNWSYTDFILRQQEEVSSSEIVRFQEGLDRLAHDEPLQYIVGREYFYGRPFQVDNRVLIPRPETEELVQLILDDHPDRDEALRVLDLGTGSGAIAISLKLERPAWQVSASDVSKDALDLARMNAENLQADVDFVAGDLLHPFIETGQKFDLVVSNPPYIGENERGIMDQSVLKYEPGLALFADDGGLAAYSAIIGDLGLVLSDQGKAYFEIGYKQGAAVEALLKKSFENAIIEVIKDSQGLDRIVTLSQAERRMYE